VARQLKPCGTRAAYERHRKHSEKPCDACMKAAATHTAAKRESRPDVREAERTRQRVIARAMRQLAREYPARFLEIHDALKALDQTEPAR
jgi:hypothetical protein